MNGSITEYVEDPEFGLCAEFDLTPGIYRGNQMHTRCRVRLRTVEDTLFSLELPPPPDNASDEQATAYTIRCNMQMLARRVIKLGELPPDAWAYPAILSLFPEDAPVTILGKMDELEKKHKGAPSDAPALNGLPLSHGNTLASAEAS